MPTQKRRPTRLSEVVIRRQRPAVDIEKSASSNAEKVAADLEPFLLRGLPEGASLPDMALIQIVLGAVVLHDSEVMEAADEAHFEALSRFNRLGLVRDAFKRRLIPTLADIRDTFDTAYGPDSCQRILGLGVNIPSDTLRLRRVADRVLRQLTAPDFELPPAVSEIAGVDLEKWVGQLRPDLTGLRDTIDRLSDAKREFERTQAAKSDAVETYGRTYLRCSLMLETIYKVSGNDHLAEKLRPPTPKSKTPDTEADAEQAPAEAGEQAAEGDDGGGEAAEEEPSEAEVPEAEARPDRPPDAARPDRPPDAARPDRPPDTARPDRPPAVS